MYKEIIYKSKKREIEKKKKKKKKRKRTIVKIVFDQILLIHIYSLRQG